jgi:hypothetical protein
MYSRGILAARFGFAPETEANELTPDRRRRGLQSPGIVRGRSVAWSDGLVLLPFLGSFVALGRSRCHRFDSDPGRRGCRHMETRAMDRNEDAS